jgi:hypothetical protein
MIDPDGLLDHAEKLANAERGRPTDVDLRRGISAAYYAVYHELTGQAASHLVGSCPQRIQNEIRRSWSHGEISQLAEYVVDRAEVLHHSPLAALPRRLEGLGPLLDVVATDSALVNSLQLFNDMQELRHSADYDHGVEFATWDLVQACDSARLARMSLRDASSAAREALFTLLTVRRADFRQR